MTQTAFARSLGLAQPSMSNLLNGKTAPGAVTLLKLAEIYDANPQWVMYGDEPEKFSEVVAGAGLDSEVADRYRKLSDGQRRMFMAMLTAIEAGNGS